MYRTGKDPYCYPGIAVLRNRLNLRSQAELDQFEAFMTAQRADEPMPPGRLSYSHYRAIHRHLFQGRLFLGRQDSHGPHRQAGKRILLPRAHRSRDAKTISRPRT